MPLPYITLRRLRVQQVADAPQEVGTLEAVKVKLLMLGEESAPSGIRVELTSENDLFFNYVHTLDEAGFRQVRRWPERPKMTPAALRNPLPPALTLCPSPSGQVQEAQKLMVDFLDYPSVLTRMLDTCIVRACLARTCLHARLCLVIRSLLFTLYSSHLALP